jgi:uncharacterized protein (UPF0548 family)
MRTPYVAGSDVMNLSYDDVGATRGRLPDGFHHIDRRIPIGTGRGAYAAAVTGLMNWDMHRRAGLRVESDTRTAEADSTVVLKLGPVRIPCQVVYVIDEDHRAGFAYGTLAGHPEQGEECFLVEFDGDSAFDEDDAVVYAHIRAFSRPGRWFTKIGGPVGRGVQRVFTDRYIAALKHLART